jgi:hypothetical protein
LRVSIAANNVDRQTKGGNVNPRRLLLIAAFCLFVPVSDADDSIQTAHEAAAILSVRTIGSAQVLHSVTRGRGKFTDLATLGREGLIDSQLASGQKQGYLFSSKPVIAKNEPPMFDVTARPKSVGPDGTGNRSFYSNETMVIYEAKGGDPPSATPSDRVPKNGSPIQ